MGFRGLLLRGAVAFAIALAAGHLVQFLRSDLQAASISPDVRPSAAPSPASSSVPASASLSSGLAGDVPQLVGITTVAADVEKTDRCQPALSLAPAPEAMIDIALQAPCNGGERIVVRHAGLSITARTDAEGRAHLRIPALQPDAAVAIYLSGSDVAFGSLAIPEASQLRRFVFQWGSNEPFSLRVTEGGQVFVGGEPAQPHDKVLSLGNAAVQDPMQAQVYTFPASAAADVALSVELRVGPATCGRTLAAQILMSEWGYVRLTEQTIAVPLCGTSGDILVLNNLAPDLTLASPK